jgi:2-iminobutanoate/2-iminopropanoate deaminase
MPKRGAHLAWQNLQAQLRAADMGIENLVKITTIVRNSADIPAVRRRPRGGTGRASACKWIVGGLSKPAWKVEVDGIATA